MALTSGDKLGPYEILAPLGAGGMGEVYKARDTRLDRTVAVKVLPDHIAQRDDLRARFEREARAVASLNHPNICTLHDIGTQDGAGYMVMEFMEGETLAQRIEKGALPLDLALRFATQVADALDRAHRAGVTHRDVKPQNIMLTRDGVKVLDFGLAKSVASKPGPTEATLTKVLTTEGTVMGTPQYMAPEQFEGKEADARSDIWAFGAVLYEMVAGRKAFEGKSYSSLLGAILSADPAPMAVQPFTPSWLDRLVRRCLEKDPDERWQSMRDVVLELRKPPVAEVAAPVAARAGRLPWVVAGVAVLATGLVWFSGRRPAPPQSLLRLELTVPEKTPMARVDVGSGTGGSVLAISPDGSRLAVALRGADGTVRLHTRLLSQSHFQVLAGTENAYSPFFSPAGDWIGFFADGKLKKVGAEGGATMPVCDAPMGYGASWGADGTIVLSRSYSGGLWRVPAAGGTPVQLTKLEPGEASHRWPQVLPGGETVLFTAARATGVSYDDAEIDAVSLKSGERKVVQRGGFSGRFVGPGPGAGEMGHLVFMRQATLFAVPFDPVRLMTSGTVAPVLENASNTMGAGGDYALADNGTCVYLARRAVQAKWTISWLEASGNVAPLLTTPGQYQSLRISPDGKRLAFSLASPDGWDIWVKDLDRDPPRRLTNLRGSNNFPVWTSDGKHIVFRSSNWESPGLYGVRADGSGEPRRLLEGISQSSASSFSPDGKRLAFSRPGDGGATDLFTVPVEPDAGRGGVDLRLGTAELFLGKSSRTLAPMFSPDGRWMAYMSDESGVSEVYVRPYPGPGGRWQISTGGGRAPIWSRDGKVLFFRKPDDHIMAVGVTATRESFSAGTPRLWSNTRLRRVALNISNYDISPDGKRAAAMIADGSDAEDPAPQIHVLVNFLEELRRRAPGGK